MSPSQKKAIQNLKKVFSWLCNKKYEVIFHNNSDSVIFCDKKIFIDKRSTLENQLYSILSYAYRLSVLEEEIDAWKRGKKLAKRLNIKIDEIKFEKYKAKYTMTYVDWAASKEWEWQC